MDILREFIRMLKTRQGRSMLVYSWVIEVPGRLGVLLRRRAMDGQFAKAGRNLGIRQGVYFRNPQNIVFGDSVDIGNDSMLQAGAGITLGDNVLLGPGVKLWTQSHSFQDLDIPIREQPNNYEPISIGDNCWIGSNAFIMPGVKLPNGCVVSAGSVVGIKAYKENTILMGNPARFLGFRGNGKSKDTDS